MLINAIFKITLRIIRRPCCPTSHLPPLIRRKLLTCFVLQREILRKVIVDYPALGLNHLTNISFLRALIFP